MSGQTASSFKWRQYKLRENLPSRASVAAVGIRMSLGHTWLLLVPSPASQPSDRLLVERSLSKYIICTWILGTGSSSWRTKSKPQCFISVIFHTLEWKFSLTEINKFCNVILLISHKMYQKSISCRNYSFWQCSKYNPLAVCVRNNRFVTRQKQKRKENTHFKCQWINKNLILFISFFYIQEKTSYPRNMKNNAVAKPLIYIILKRMCFLSPNIPPVLLIVKLISLTHTCTHHVCQVFWKE